MYPFKTPFLRRYPYLLVFIFCAILLTVIDTPAQTDPITLIDPDGNEIIFDLPNSEELPAGATFCSEGSADGACCTNNDGSCVAEFGWYFGVKFDARQFSTGERIVATWYNTSDEIITFSSRISFTDEDEPSEESPDGNWYTMRSFNDYRYTYQQIQPHSFAKTVFNITNTGVHKTDEIYSLVNVSPIIEYGENDYKQYFICDKIELWFDADITPPEQPAGLQATSLSNTKIFLQWNAPDDNVGVVEYLIYNNGIVEGYSRGNSYTAVLLNQNTEHTFTVSAFDAIGNESLQSAPVTISTMNFQGTNSLINPSGFEYLGAFTTTESFAYGGDGIAINPNGDGGQAGAGSVDGFPGSLFISDINQPEHGFVGEISIPSPVISPTRNLAELNQAAIIQNPVNIRPANINNWDYVDVWINGLEYIEEENRLYSSWAIYYDVTGDKTASITCVDASDLSGGTKYGAWFLGSSSDQVLPLDPYLNDYLFHVPSSWADDNIFGRELINGRYREGGLSGLGPTFYAFDVLGAGDPPAANTELDFSTLLEYGTVIGTDNYNYPNSIDGYNHADWWKGADWISVGSQAAIAIIGDKALGQNYYGYNGELMRHDWIIADQPYPEFWETDPDGKGWKAHTMQPMIAFYDPNDLAAAANGTIDTYEPQPYAVLRLDKNLFFGENAQISSAAFDEYNSLLYITEIIPEMDGNLAIHVWRISNVTEVEEGETSLPSEFNLEQNYPNPFNPSTKIIYSIQERSNVSIKVYDILGKEVATIENGIRNAGTYNLNFHAAGLTSGIYFYTLKINEFQQTRKMMLLK